MPKPNIVIPAIRPIRPMTLSLNLVRIMLMKVLSVNHHSMDPLNTPAIMKIAVYTGSEEDAKPIEANIVNKSDNVIYM